MILFRPVSCMEKCFLDEDISVKKEIRSIDALALQEVAFQAAYTSDSPADYPRATTRLEIDSPLSGYITVRLVAQVPVTTPAFADTDDNYLRKTPGLYPDLLLPLDPDSLVFPTYGQLKALYVSMTLPESLKSGSYPVTLRLISSDGTCAAEAAVSVNLTAAALPPQTLKYTQWFHCDCIAGYYGLEVFSETHWTYIKNFIKTAVKNGINTILTPVFTPPLDTEPGHERLTVQLVDVARTGDGWKFGFEKLERWVAVCLECGIEYFEISHLYSQWGAAHAPKICGTDINGNYTRLFGWETDSLSDEYRCFLREFLTELLAEMKKLGVDGRCMFHVSDEPEQDALKTYTAAKNQIADILSGHRIMDALSDFEFYSKGVLDNPVPSTDHIEPFLNAGVSDLWTYYCCGQHRGVSNRFISMSMDRGRIIGIQLWKFNLKGFLQWGYNFYNSRGSIRHINPYLITDGESWVPAGDTFSVYPGPDGEPYETLHMKSFTMALQDMRALQLAEKLAGREAVMKIVDASGEITFAEYPHAPGTVEGIMSEIYRLIGKAVENNGN